MIRTIDFNNLPSGTIVDDEYNDQGVTVSASGGSGLAMAFDTNNPTGGDSDLGSDTLDGVLIISEDGDSTDPDDNADGGSLFFDFDGPVDIKSLTFKDIEENADGTFVCFLDDRGNVIDEQYIFPTEDGGELTVRFGLTGVSRMEVKLEGSGAIDNLVFKDDTPEGDDGPTAVDDAATTPEDTSIVIDVRSNDTDPQDATSDLTISGATSPDGTVLNNGDGTLTFTPDADFNGPTTISYTVTDTDGNSDTGEVAVTVTPVNDAPVAVDDQATTPAETLIENIPVLANDTDIDGDTLRVVSATSVEGTVTINGDGTFNFLPGDGYTGAAEISYVISDRPVGDPDALTDTGTVTVQVIDGIDTRDGFVDGDEDPNLIDIDYDGDPDGDFVDANDEILPGSGPNDDVIRAGGGDDTIIAGEGNDSIIAGTGDDVVEGEDGNDTVDGGDGDDLIETGNGDLAPDLGYPRATTDPLGYDPDTDPENDRDLVSGGDGNDTISTGDDRDTIFGDAGDDVIDGGIDDDQIDGGADDDRIVGGEGNDNILGGVGDDTIYAGNDPDLGLDVLALPDEATDGFIFSPDRNPDNGRDTVDGGAGNDVIFGADDDDVLFGGSGDDYIDGEVDDDTIDGNTGADTLLGGQGDDSVEGGQGDDILDGGDGNDTLRGNRDNDIIMGGAGDDSIDGGGEDDELFGGDGDDSIMGGQGDDDIDGGAGADTMTGGAGRDLFFNVNAGDDIDGGSGAVDFDTLDLTGSATESGRLEITYTSEDREDGFVDYFNEDGSDAGRLNFVEIENVIPCFTPGTKIATPKGERLVEELQVGDRVITRDNGMQEIRWVGARQMRGQELQSAEHLRPVLIQAGALGNGLPERDMMVSPNHRVLIANDKTALYFEEREVLVAAKHLTDMEGIDVVDVSGTTYIHIMFDQHEVILSDGCWTESFQPGDMSLAGIGDAQREEILELFPELATREGVDGYASARRSLKKFEAKLVTK